MSIDFSTELPSEVTELVNEDAFAKYPLGAPDRALAEKIDRLDLSDLFPAGVADEQLGMCCLSGVWLLHHFLDQSHEISQSIKSAEGSFWHAIMHRLEGDFPNSKYWYRNVGSHPVFDSVEPGGGWDPFEFVDQCESANRHGGGAIEQVQQIAVAEWKSLFSYCYRNAV